MASKYASTAQTTNAARLSRAIVDPCTDLYRDILRIHISEMQFLTTLKTVKDNLCRLVNREQRELLYPRNGHFCGTYNDFDLGLLYILLRNVSGIPPHKNGWGKTPDSTDRSESANIDRLREIRNKYCGHQPRSSLSDAEFKNVWAELMQIVGELDNYVSGGHNIYLNAIKLLENETMDPEQEEMYLNTIDNQHKSISDLQGKQIQLEEQLTVQSLKQEKQSEELDELSKVQLNQRIEIRVHEEAFQQHKESHRKQAEALSKLEEEHKQISLEHKEIATEISRQGAEMVRRIEEKVDHSRIEEVQTRLKENHNELKKELDSQNDVNRNVKERLTKQECSQKEIIEQQHKQRSRLTALENLSSTETQNILDNTQKVLERHRFSETYVRTSAVQATVATLDKQHIAILTGKGGVGKTTTAYQVMFELSQETNKTPRTPILIKTPEQWDKVVNPAKHVIVYIDDMFGASNLDIGLIDKWKGQFDSIHSSAKHGNVFVILGLRETILDEAMKFCDHHELFGDDCEVDFSSEYALSKQEKEDILEAFQSSKKFKASDLKGERFEEYANKHGSDTIYEIPVWMKMEIVDSQPFYGFPLTCFQFFSRKYFFELGPSFFHRPNEKLFASIEQIRRSENLGKRISYCVLVYVLLNDEISAYHVDDAIFESICSHFRISQPKVIDIRDAITDLKGLFLNETVQTDTFIFSHETVREAVLVSFGQVAPELIMKFCSKNIIHELIRTQECVNRKHEIVLKIPKRCYGDMARRLLEFEGTEDVALESSFVADYVVSHPGSNDPGFVPYLFKSKTEDIRWILDHLLYKFQSNNYCDRQVLLNQMLECYGPHVRNPKSDASMKEAVTLMDCSAEYPCQTSLTSFLNTLAGYDTPFFNSASTSPFSSLLQKVGDGLADQSLMEETFSAGNTTTNRQSYTSGCTDDQNQPNVLYQREDESNANTTNVSNSEIQDRPFKFSVKDIKKFLLESVMDSAVDKMLCLVKYLLAHENLHDLIRSDYTIFEAKMSLLHCCVLHGWDEVVNSLLEIHQPTKLGNNMTCAHLAAYSGRLSLLKKFVDLGQDMKEKTHRGHSVIQSALFGLRYSGNKVLRPFYNLTDQSDMDILFPGEDQYEEVFRYILQRMSDESEIQRDTGITIDSFGNGTAFYLVIHSYHHILDLISKYNVDILFHRSNSDLCTTLHVAIYLGRWKLARSLFDKGVRPFENDLPLIDVCNLGETHHDADVSYSLFEIKPKKKSTKQAAKSSSEVPADHVQSEKVHENTEQETSSSTENQDEERRHNSKWPWSAESICSDVSELGDFKTGWNNGEEEVPSILLEVVEDVSIRFGSMEDYQATKALIPS